MAKAEQMLAMALFMRKVVTAYKSDTGAQMSSDEVKAFLALSCETQGITVDELVTMNDEYERKASNG